MFTNRLRSPEDIKKFDLLSPVQKIYFKKFHYVSIRDNFLTFQDLKVLFHNVSGEVEFIAYQSLKSPFTYTLHFTYTHENKEHSGYLIHSHGKSMRYFKSLNTLSNLIYEEFRPDCFTISFSG